MTEYSTQVFHNNSNLAFQYLTKHKIFSVQHYLSTYLSSFNPNFLLLHFPMHFQCDVILCVVCVFDLNAIIYNFM